MSALLPAPGKQKRIIANAANRYGLNPALLWGVYGAETDFGRNVSTSGAGAVGPFQFMPGTARGMGIDPLNFRQAAFGAARYLSQYKGRGVAGMLAAYNAGPAGNPNNPETRAYIPRVQELARSWNGPDAAGGGTRGGGGGRGGRAVSGPLGLQTTSPDGSALTALLAGMRPERPQIQSAGIAPPTFSAAAPMPKGYQAPAAGSAAPAPAGGSSLAAALQQIAGTAPGSSRVTGGGVQPGASGGGGGGPATGLRRGQVQLAPDADRAGVPTSKIVRGFVSLVAGSVGHPITITTGSNHNQMTTSGNQSDHWTGRAADIAVPVDSRQGDMIAGRALMLLGYSRQQARQMAQQGGLYTVTPRTGPLRGHRVQVIWRTTEGGNHHNHVHIGID